MLQFPYKTRSRALLRLAMLLVALSGNIGEAIAEEAESATETAPTTAPLELDVEALLLDPVPADSSFAHIREIRRALAWGEITPAAFEQAASQMEELEAYYSAIGLLWFADLMTNDDTERERLMGMMQRLITKYEIVASDVDAVLQIQAAGRPDEALKELLELRKEHPMHERVYYEIGHAYMNQFLAQMEKSETAIDTKLRAQVFRICYREFTFTTILDPLFSDAWRQMNDLRYIFPDSPEMIEATDPLARHALAFATEVSPAVEKLERGERTPEALLEAAQAFGNAGMTAYGIFACHAALAHTPDEALQAEIETTLSELKAELR